MEFDLWFAYRQMLRSRLFEQAVAKLWHDGRISGEMHLGLGEEAVITAVVLQMGEDDAMALDHRGTAAMLLRGVDPVLLLREFLGREDGLCHGMGGHMHLFSNEHLAASSGIVGASGPAGTGFALAARHLRPGSVAVAFFGEGAVNEGMMMESFNLASAWDLPVLFVCKDNAWAVSTSSPAVTGGDILARAQSFGLMVMDVDGSDVEAVWQAAENGFAHARQKNRPVFLHARCVHLEGHFLGDPLLSFTRQPARQFGKYTLPLLRAMAKRKGAPVRVRAAALQAISAAEKGVRQQTARRLDPVYQARRKLWGDPERLETIQRQTREEIDRILRTALDGQLDEEGAA